MNVDSIFSPSVEKKRKQRMKKAGKIEEVAENYNSLVMYYICLSPSCFINCYKCYSYHLV